MYLLSLQILIKNAGLFCEYFRFDLSFTGYSIVKLKEHVEGGRGNVR